MSLCFVLCSLLSASGRGHGRAEQRVESRDQTFQSAIPPFFRFSSLSMILSSQDPKSRLFTFPQHLPSSPAANNTNPSLKMVLPPYILHKPLPKSHPVPSANPAKVFATSANYSATSPRTLVRRTADGALLLADPITNDPALQALLFRSYPGRASLAVLNHENILSIHGDFVNQLVGGVPPKPVNTNITPEEEEAEEDSDPTPALHRYLVYDYCDAGTVASLLNDPPVRATQTGFLPESLVWHVALGVLRALRWLHEGVREIYGVQADTRPHRVGRCRRVRGKTTAEEGWMPILHCAVRGENLFLVQPRGIETYGAVKLGNFGSCCVVRGEGVRVAVKSAGERRLGKIREERGVWREESGKRGVRAAQDGVNMVGFCFCFVWVQGVVLTCMSRMTGLFTPAATSSISARSSST